MMGTITNKLTYLAGTKEAIKNAIASKGVEVLESDSFRSYASKITNIQADGNNSIEDSIVTRTITTYTNERITSVGNHAFMHCAQLISISLPNAKTAGLSTFNNCTKLIDVNLPSLETMNTQTFYGCSSLEYITLPKLKSVAAQSLRNCKKLSIVDLYVCTSIANLSFDSDASLKCLIIRTPTLCTLVSSAALTGTLIAGGTGYIYVPRVLVSSYQSAEQWSTYESQFRVLEDYTVDGTTIGDIDESKI